MTEMWMPGAEQRPQPGGVAMNTALPSRVTWHITWDALTNGQQPDFDGVAGYLERMGYCPTLMWDPWTGRIVQFYPANQGGRALVNWNQDGRYNIQIETFFSPGAVRDGVTYQTVADTPCNGLDEILAWTDSLGIPRVWPMGAPQWTNNSRDPGIWNSEAGHYGHCNVPDNTHTDPGPMPDLNRGGIAAQGTITPLSEEDDMALFASIEEFQKAVSDAVQASHTVTRANIIKTVTENTEAQHVETRKQAVATTQAQHDVTRGYLTDRIPAAVLNQPFTLTDGTKTNLAGILSAINAKPAGTTTVTNAAPAPVDVDAIVARLKAELPAAVLAELTTKLTK